MIDREKICDAKYEDGFLALLRSDMMMYLRIRVTQNTAPLDVIARKSILRAHVTRFRCSSYK